MQLTYAVEQGKAYEGGRADSNPARIVAGLNKSAAEVLFGRFVALLPGAADANLTVLKPDDYVPFGPMVDANSKIVGGLLHDMAHTLGVEGAKANDMGSILKTGAMFVKSETALKPGDNVFVRFAAGNGGAAANIGLVRNDTDITATLATAVQLPSAEVRGYCAAGEIVAIHINLP